MKTPALRALSAARSNGAKGTKNNPTRYHVAGAALRRIEGDTVLVQGGSIEHPVYVRYAWANSALEANLYNRAGLPASAFTSQRHVPPPCMHDCK